MSLPMQMRSLLRQVQYDVLQHYMRSRGRELNVSWTEQFTDIYVCPFGYLRL
jgi:hypothetical protein